MPNKLNILSDTSQFKEQETLYGALREKEGRLYSDEIVKMLPYINEQHPLSHEWKIRAASFEKLKKHLSAKNTSLQILDLGCGNGWMGNGLTQINNSKTTCLDINLSELEQGARVFHENENLKFIYGDIFDEGITSSEYDVIIIASAIQYFPHLDKLISRLLTLLKTAGEIHIVDSPIYSQLTVTQAMKRSEYYYEKIGFESMKSYYHHHTWDDFGKFTFSVKNRSLLDHVKLKFFRITNLFFPWVVISKQ